MMKMMMLMMTVMTVGGLRDDDGSGSVAKKVSLRRFKLYRVCLVRLICQKQANFPWVEFVRTLSRIKKRMENSSSYVQVLHESKLHVSMFHIVIVQWTSMKWCTCRAVVLLIKSIVFFFDVVVVVVAWLLKLPAGKDENENDDADDVSGWWWQYRWRRWW